MRKLKFFSVLLAVGLLFSTNMWATTVAKIGDQGYETLAAALMAAQNGNVIKICQGTWGADQVGSLTTAEAGVVRYKSLTIQPEDGKVVTFTSLVYLGYDDSSTANATMTVKNLNFKNASLVLSNYVQNTVENCNFEGSNGAAGALVVMDACCTNHKTSDEYPESSVTIKNCVVNGTAVGDPGIRIRNVGNATITDNVVVNSKHNGILFETNASHASSIKSIIVKGNTITEWNAENGSGSGRGIRLAGGDKLESGSTIIVEGNYMSKTSLGYDQPDFIKIDGSSNATISLENNYWNGMTVNDVSGKLDYYTINGSASSITSVISNAVAKVGDWNFIDLHVALVHGATAGKTVELLRNVDLTGVEWAPVADFNGTFDGGGYTLSNLSVSGASGLGLFASTGTSATIQNLTITGANISGTGSNVGVLAGSIAGSNVNHVTISHSTVTSTGGQYTGGLTGYGYPNASYCVVSNCKITGYDQVGGLVGYLWVGGLNHCKAMNDTVTATSERAGGLIGKMEVAAGNLGNSRMDLINDTVVGSTITAPDFAGGICGQIMGNDPRYSIKNCYIDVSLSAPKVSPIGTLRSSQAQAFTSVLATNITGNWWTEATSADCQYTYTASETGADDQVIDRGVARIGDECYPTLAAAVAAVPTDGTETQITMTQDVALDARVTIPSTKNIVLELNGKVISLESSAQNSKTIHNQGTLTIQDASDESKKGEGTGKVTYHSDSPDTICSAGYPGWANNTILNEGRLIINSGLIENRTAVGSACYAIDNGANSSSILTINGGRFTSGKSLTIRMWIANLKDTEIKISNAVIKSFWMQDNNGDDKGKLTISNTTFEEKIIIGYYGLSDNFEFSIDNSSYGSLKYELKADATGNSIKVTNNKSGQFYMEYPKKILSNGVFNFTGEFSLGWVQVTSEHTKEWYESQGIRLGERYTSTSSWYQGYLSPAGHLQQFYDYIVDGYGLKCLDAETKTYEVVPLQKQETGAPDTIKVIKIDGTDANSVKDTVQNVITYNDAVNNFQDTKVYDATPTVEGTTKKVSVVLSTAVVTSTNVTDMKVSSMTFDVKPMVKIKSGNDSIFQVIPNESIQSPISFRLPIHKDVSQKAVEVFHKDSTKTDSTSIGFYTIQQEGADKFVELSAQAFSYYTYNVTDQVLSRSFSGIATICLPQDVTISESTVTGAKFYTIYSKDEDVKEIKAYEVTDKLVAGRGYLMQSTTNDHKLVITAYANDTKVTEALTGEGEMMIGNLNTTNLTASAAAALVAKDSIYGVKSGNYIAKCTEDAYIPQYCAFIVMNRVPVNVENPPVQSPSRLIIGRGQSSVITDLEEAFVKDAAQAEVQKVLIHGNLYIKRDGKMYNLNGMLVK